MSEFSKNEEPQEEVKQELEQPQAEMPEDFVEPEGKSGRWGKPVKAEVEVEGKKVEVSFREKVIELPKHRQEETGIKRIRRRELLPPFPEGFCLPLEEEKTDFYKEMEVAKVEYSGNQEAQENIRKNIEDYKQNRGEVLYWRSSEKFDELYKFLTDGKYPPNNVHDCCIHTFNLHAGSAKRENINKLKDGGIYFQEIFPKVGGGRYRLNQIGGKEKLECKDEISSDQDGVFYMYLGSMYQYGHSDYITPKFIFTKRNKVFARYQDTVRKLGFHPYGSGDGTQVPSVRWKNKGVKPMRWCYAELALVPTKRSLNVLFFETGDEDKNKSEKEGQSYRPTGETKQE